MRPWLSFVVFAFSIGAAMAEDLPPAVQKAIAENKRVCKTVAIEKGFITRKDINGDGRPDFVLDYESFICDGNPREFCGSIGCLTQVFASLPNGAYARVVDDNIRSIDFREVQGRPAIVLGLHGDADPCRKDPTELCEVVKSWNGSSFVEMPAPGMSPTAGIKNAKSLGPIREVLADVIAMYGKGQMGPFASDPVMRRHFTAQFISVWDRADRADIIDADPLTGQGVKSVNLQAVEIMAETPDSATVGMQLGGTNLNNSPFTGGARLFMRREGSVWKIDDVSDSEHGTWRRSLEKLLGAQVARPHP
jgi:hypothetical protein